MNHLARLRPLFRKIEVNPRRLSYATFVKTTHPLIKKEKLLSFRVSPSRLQTTASFVIDNNVLKGAIQPVNDEQKLGKFILDTLDESPDHVSQIEVETGLKTTHAEMKDRSIRCALWLKQLGIGPNDIIVVCSENRLHTYVPVFASFFVDAIFSAWNCSLTIYTARRYLKQFTPKVIFVGERAFGVIEEAARLEGSNVVLVRMNDLEKITSAQSEEQVDNFSVVNAKSPRHASLILMSSGSTGFPKGVMSSSKAVLTNLLKQQKGASGVTPKIMWYSTLDWYSCITFILYSIYTKQTRVLSRDDGDDVERVFRNIDEYKVNRVYLPPAFVTRMAKSRLERKYDLGSLDIVFIGGSPCSKEILGCLKQTVPKAFIYHVYGTTETGVLAATTPASKHSDSVGFVSTNYQVKFMDMKSGKTLGPNQHGEIHVKSPAIMIGYYNNPQETRKAFDDEGWFRTGDLGYYDETGEIFIVDRIKEMIKRKNYQITPAEIEEILLSHPDVQEAIVIALPHDFDGERPMALCKKAPGSKVTEDELMKLTSMLEDYKKLRGGIHFIDKFLYTSSGKIARNEMKQIAKKLIEKKNKSCFL